MKSLRIHRKSEIKYDTKKLIHKYSIFEKSRENYFPNRISNALKFF